jgi:UDP-N-acetylglucosamine 2-epimerase (non-hydrolysing)
VSNGTWCPTCNKESKGEKEISRTLNELNVNYIREYMFDDCRGKEQPLPFDFYLPDYNCCIEYDGEQHFLYRETGIFENKLEKIKEYEIIKNNYCRDNNIKLIRIPYGFIKKLKKILSIEYKNNFKNTIDFTKCILIIAGTRPEELKTYGLVQTLEKNSIPVLYAFTGQHKNIVDRSKYDFLFNIKDDKNSNRLDSIVSGNINNFGRFLNKHPYISHVLVQGDTTSAFAVALSAFHHGIKVIHLEAGLRTYDKKNPYPEEVNRKLIAQIADIHLCPTKQSLINLRNEETQGDIYVVGNTVIDNLLPYKERCEYTNKILVTMHRRENHERMAEWFSEINKLAIEYPQFEFILPIHPNPNVQKHRHLLPNVTVIEPLPYEEMLELLIKTRLVITDSGGLQEECSFFNKICLVCRTTTERPESIERSSWLVRSPTMLSSMFFDQYDRHEIDYTCPFGDGHAAEKIMTIIKERL